MHEIEIGKHSLDEDPKKLGILFREMIQMDLWYAHFFSRIFVQICNL